MSTPRTRLHVEPLGDRFVPSTAVIAIGSQLIVFGDDGRNVVELVRDAAGVRVKYDGVQSPVYDGITEVLVNLGGADDRMDVTIYPDVAPGASDDFAFNANFGPGDDHVGVLYGKAIGDPQEALRSAVIKLRGELGADHFRTKIEQGIGEVAVEIDGGADNDVISARGEVRPTGPGGFAISPIRFTQKVIGGDGNDTLQSEVTAAPYGVPGYPPPKVEMTVDVDGGQGDNKITVVQKGRNPLVPVDRYGDVKNLIRAAGGNDSIWVDIDAPIMLNSAEFNVDSGGGRDKVRVGGGKIDADRFVANVITGDDDDRVNVSFQKVRSAEGTVRADTGPGADRITAALAGLTSSKGVIEFNTGAGNDLFTADITQAHAGSFVTRVDLGDGNDIGTLDLVYRPSPLIQGSQVANVGLLGGAGADVLTMNVKIKPEFVAGALSNYDLGFAVDGGDGPDRLTVTGRYVTALALHRGSVDLTVLGGRDDDRVRAFWKTAPQQVAFVGTADGGEGIDDGTATNNIVLTNFE
jgi:hypothetical protein